MSLHNQGTPPGQAEAMSLLECPVVHDEFMVRARPDAEQQTNKTIMKLHRRKISEGRSLAERLRDWRNTGKRVLFEISNSMKPHPSVFHACANKTRPVIGFYLSQQIPTRFSNRIPPTPHRREEPGRETGCTTIQTTMHIQTNTQHHLILSLSLSVSISLSLYICVISLYIYVYIYIYI